MMILCVEGIPGNHKNDNGECKTDKCSVGVIVVLLDSKNKNNEIFGFISSSNGWERENIYKCTWGIMASFN